VLSQTRSDESSEKSGESGKCYTRGHRIAKPWPRCPKENVILFCANIGAEKKKASKKTCTDMARTTRLVIRIKNIYTCGDHVSCHLASLKTPQKRLVSKNLPGHIPWRTTLKSTLRKEISILNNHSVITKYKIYIII